MASELQWRDTEILDTGDEGRPSRPIWRRVLLPAALVVALTGWWGDSEVRDREHGALLDAVSIAQTEANQADDLVWRTLQYMAPTLYSFDVPDSLHQDLKGTIQHMASKGAGDIRMGMAAVERVRILPWHDDLNAARDSYIAYLSLKAEGLEDFWGVGRDDLPAGRQLGEARAALMKTAPDAETAKEVRQILSRRT